MFPSPQQEYEKSLHFLYEEDEKAQIRLVITDPISKHPIQFILFFQNA